MMNIYSHGTILYKYEIKSKIHEDNMDNFDYFKM